MAAAGGRQCHVSNRVAVRGVSHWAVAAVAARVHDAHPAR